MEKYSVENEGNKRKPIYYGSNINVCVICGTEVPEGREVCPICVDKVLDED